MANIKKTTFAPLSFLAIIMIMAGGHVFLSNQLRYFNDMEELDEPCSQSQNSEAYNAFRQALHKSSEY
jgi:hypothetical protein